MLNKDIWDIISLIKEIQGARSCMKHMSVKACLSEIHLDALPTRSENVYIRQSRSDFFRVHRQGNMVLNVQSKFKIC